MKMKELSSEDISDRLYIFNVTNDWSVFSDVPDSQAVCVMYPNVIFPIHIRSKEEKLEYLRNLFKPTQEAINEATQLMLMKTL